MKTVKLSMTRRVEVPAQELLQSIQADGPAMVGQSDVTMGFEHTLRRLSVQGQVVEIAVEFNAAKPPLALRMVKGTRGSGSASITVTPDGPAASRLNGTGTFNIEGRGAKLPDGVLETVANKVLDMALNDLVKDVKGRGGDGLAA